MESQKKHDIILALKKQWYASKDGTYFYKHVEGGRNKLYSILLSGTKYDGIYELSTVSSVFDGDIINSNKDIVIRAKGNLDFALFESIKNENIKDYKFPRCCDSFGYCIIREEYKTEEAFKSELLSTGLITESEYDIYTNSICKQYNFKKSPKLDFVM